jgi:hypothetical protein
MSRSARHEQKWVAQACERTRRSLDNGPKIRNSKSETNSKPEIPRSKQLPRLFWICFFGHWDLFRISNLRLGDALHASPCWFAGTPRVSRHIPHADHMIAAGGGDCLAVGTERQPHESDQSREEQADFQTKDHITPLPSRAEAAFEASLVNLVLAAVYYNNFSPFSFTTTNQKPGKCIPCLL